MRPAFALLCLAAMASAAEPVVLLTAYGPFAGRGVNGSETVARGLDGAELAGARIRILVLPVRWGEPERVLPAAVADAHPVLLLGLGEGWPDAATVERQAVNRAEHADEAGHPPPAALDSAGPAVRHATLRFDRTWFPADASLRPSDDAGTYLCNSLLYVATAQPVPRAGFMHLPPQGETPVAEYRARWMPLVRTLIERNLPVAP
jgi:pyroglutamyl-peptidase